MPQLIKHIIGWFILALVILAAIFLVRYRLAELSAMPPPTKVPMPVKVAVVTSGPLSIIERYLGRIQPVHSVALASNVAGYLMRVSGYPGDFLASDEVLIRVDDRRLRKKVAALEAELDGAVKELLIREKDTKSCCRFRPLFWNMSLPDRQLIFTTAAGKSRSKSLGFSLWFLVPKPWLPLKLILPSDPLGCQAAQRSVLAS